MTSLTMLSQIARYVLESKPLQQCCNIRTGAKAPLEYHYFNHADILNYKVGTEATRKRKISESVLLWNPYTQRKPQKATRQHKNATESFDYTTLMGRFRTVSWSNDKHPTRVVKLRYGIPKFPLATKASFADPHFIFKCEVGIWTNQSRVVYSDSEG